MPLEHLLARLSELEARVRTLEQENATLNAYIAELESALKNKADSKSAKKPLFSLNYSVERNQESGDETQIP